MTLFSCLGLHLCCKLCMCWQSASAILQRAVVNVSHTLTWLLAAVLLSFHLNMSLGD